MSTASTKNRADYKTRWYVRQEAILVPFGISTREALVWAVYRTDGRDAKGRPRLVTQTRTTFPAERGGRRGAYRYACNEARRHYGNTR